MRHPRLIHRVWLGPGTPRYDFADQWADTHPDWELVTWTDANVGELDLVAAKAYEQAPTYVHRADLILVEAVHAHGGVSVGFDSEPLRDIEPLIDAYDAWCTPDADGFPGQAFFGAVPGHRAMRAVLERAGPRIAERGGFNPATPHEDTGPYLWGDVFGRFGERAADHGLTIFGDWKIAYPIRYWEKSLFDVPELFEARRRDAYLMHWFAHSWANPDNVLIRRPS
jgi:mannosyltransferase OCH1-like enzyme